MVETPESVNTEFYPDGIGRRKGSSLQSELTAAINNALIADDSVVAVNSFTRFDKSRRITIAVGKKGVYANAVESASFQQLFTAKFRNPALPSRTATTTAYAHNEDIVDATIIEFEGRALIGLNGANRVLAYSSAWSLNAGKGLPKEVSHSAYVMDSWIGGRAGVMTAAGGAGSFRTATVSSGDVNGLRPGDVVTDGNAFHTIHSVNTASSVIVFDYTTGAGFAAQFYRGNTFTEFYGSGDDLTSTAHVMTGAIDEGNYLLDVIHNRILYGVGDGVVNFTPNYNAAASGVWDFAAGGFFVSPSPVRAMSTFVPEGGGDMNAHIYMFTDKGVVSRPGMSDFDEVIQNNASGAVLNKNCVAQIENWLVYLTKDKQLRAVNGRFDIDIGRRLKSRDGSSGPLDAMDVARSEATAFLHYDAKKKKLYAHFSSATAFFNDRIAVLDFELGEPVLGEPQESFEVRVRCLDWRIDTPTENEGFVTMLNIDDAVVGFRQNGTAWKINDGDSDFTANTIQASWYTPQLSGGDPTIEKHWQTTRVAMMNQGSHSVVQSKRSNRQGADTDMATFAVSDADGIVINTTQFGEHKYVAQVGIRNENSVAAEPWILTAVGQEYTADEAEL